MSSTNRTKTEKLVSMDYYATPLQSIRDFMTAARADDHDYSDDPDRIVIDAGLSKINAEMDSVLDPCAGGDAERPMSYPTVLAEFGFKSIDTIDIRQDSLASVKGDYLNTDCKGKYSLIITNPPFNLALEIIKKALDDVKDNGHVIMLQRLNFLGSQVRQEFFRKNMPKAVYVHSRRMKFHKLLGSDSVEYAHYVWDKYSCDRKFACLRVI